MTWGLGDTVVRNDFEPALISVADTTVAEPGAGTAFAEVPVSLSGPNGFVSPDAPRAGRRGQPVTVHYETADGTATAGQDYTARLRHPHLRSGRTRDIPVSDDPDPD